MLKRIFLYLFYGISMGCTIFVLICITATLTANGNFPDFIRNDFIRQAVGSIIVSVCCGSSAIVYSFKKLALWQCICIHFTIGLTGYFVVSFLLGWIPTDNVYQIIGYSFCGVLFFVAIWFAFYRHNKKEAELLNKRIKQMEEDAK